MHLYIISGINYLNNLNILIYVSAQLIALYLVKKKEEEHIRSHWLCF